MQISKPWFRRKIFLTDDPYYLERTELEGESDMFKMSDENQREFEIIFYPESNRWVKLPSRRIKEVKKETDFGLFIRIPEYNEFFGKNPIHYHTHPKAIETERIKLIEKMVEQDHSKEILDKTRAAIQSVCALPSDADIKAFLDPKTSIISEFRIISPHGIVRTSIKNRGSQIEDQYNDVVRNYAVKICTKNIQMNIQNIISKVNKKFGEYLEMEFVPRKE